MVLVHHDSVMVGTTGVTTTTGMTTVLTNTTVTSGDVTALLSVVVESGRLYNINTNIQCPGVRDQRFKIRCKYVILPS